jgi:Tol biopolymer transport system component
MSSKLGPRLLLALAVAGILPACGNINDGHPAVPFTVRASVSTLGAEANSSVEAVKISGNGRYVVFASAADTLVSGDTNGIKDVFRRDLLTGVTELVSIGFLLDPTDDESDFPSISNDGRYVAFSSFATNLVATPQFLPQIYVRDMNATSGNGIVLVSQDSLGNPGDDGSIKPAISGDGIYIAYESFATNLAGTHPVGMSHIYRTDWGANTTLQVTVTSLGAEPTQGPVTSVPTRESRSAAISDDGSRIAFVAGFTDLVSGDTNGLPDVFVATIGPLGAVTIVLASDTLDPFDPVTDAYSDHPSISGDGKFVAFDSKASNLVKPDSSLGNVDVYVFNVDFPAVERVSLNSSGIQAAIFDSQRPALSQDGRYVVFDSAASNLIDGDTNGALDVFIRDRVTGVTQRVSLNTSANQSGVSENSSSPSLSSDGRSVAFLTVAPFVNDDSNGLPDVYVRSPLR